MLASFFSTLSNSHFSVSVISLPWCCYINRLIIQ
jgi:hypothetical protein